MKTVVDTSALLALLYPDDAHNERASSLLHEAYNRGALVVPDVVYAELAADSVFDERSDLEHFLTDTGLDRESPSSAALFAAGKRFQTHLDRRGEALQCPSCGERALFRCPSCDTEITARQHIAADFVIGAQAELDADALLTFDEGFYREYFDVEVLTAEG